MKEHILTVENLTRLVELLNEEMDAASVSYQDEMDTVSSEIGDAERRLSRLYDAIENGNIDYSLLKLRLQEYVNGLRKFLDSGDLPARRAFIKGFVKQVKVTGNEGRIVYTFPVPPENLDEESLGVLPTVRYGGRYRI